MSVALIVLWIVLPILLISFGLAFFYLVKGPTLADRVVALDILGFIAIGIVCAYAIATNNAMLIDVASIVALISFLSTIAFAKFLQNRVLE